MVHLSTLAAKLARASKATMAFVMAVLTAASYYGLPEPYDHYVATALLLLTPLAVYWAPRNADKPVPPAV